MVQNNGNRGYYSLEEITRFSKAMLLLFNYVRLGLNTNPGLYYRSIQFPQRKGFKQLFKVPLRFQAFTADCLNVQEQLVPIRSYLQLFLFHFMCWENCYLCTVLSDMQLLMPLKLQ